VARLQGKRPAAVLHPFERRTRMGERDGVEGKRAFEGPSSQLLIALTLRIHGYVDQAIQACMKCSSCRPKTSQPFASSYNDYNALQRPPG
jgi:hypothetical protein